MGIESSIMGVTSTVTGGYYISPPCYVTVCYGCYVTCYAIRGLRLLLKAWRNIKTPKCYGRGVTLSTIGDSMPESDTLDRGES